ncbi:transketolase [Actinomadura nitritigenes]|uniref:transketolase n=1 Tax=Actinomadura nitritigenes TaxID=134602 RepID=UPI003D8D27FC
MTATSAETAPAELDTNTRELLRRKSIENRIAVLDQVEVSGSGHYGPAFSCMEILVSLYYGYLRLRPDEPAWQDRDRFVLSKGHACSALYPILADLDFFGREHLDDFCRLGSILGDHPDMKKVPGIDFSSGSLGHGLSIAVGMAEGARLRGIGNRVVALLGDGELGEGQVWEAAAHAGARRISRLLAFVDVNGVSVDGTTAEILATEPITERFESFGWRSERIDGHDHDALRAALASYDAERLRPDGRPTVIVADTVVGRGVPFIEGLSEWHVGYFAGIDRQRAEDGIRGMFDSADTLGKTERTAR